MKTVSGTIVSSKPVRLSKAANILSKFVQSDNGASQAVSAYLRRASEAFNQHVYFKKHHKFKKKRSKEEASTISDITHRDIHEYEGTCMENGGGANRELFDQNPVEVDEYRARKVEGKLRKKDKKKKKTKDPESGKNDNIEVETENGIEAVKEKSEEKKKTEDLKSGKNDNIEVGTENGIEAVKEKSEEKKKKKKKKRKNAEVDGVEIGNSVTPEKKKRRKTKADE